MEKKRKNQERKEAQKMLEQQNAESDSVRVLVRNSATGEVITGLFISYIHRKVFILGEQAPRAEELDTWMEMHPGYEVISRDAGSDADEDDYDDRKQNSEDIKDDDEFDGLDEEQRNKKIIEKARNEEDEYSSNRQQMESYYATAHRIRERVVKQHSSLGKIAKTRQFNWL